ncbi:hypothetical protein ACHAXT_006695 [Thalassiosira profunda]
MADAENQPPGRPVTPIVTGTAAGASPRGASEKGNDGDVDSSLREQTLSRLAVGLPIHELDTIIKEAKVCEDALEKELKTLEAAAGINADGKENSDGKGENKEPVLSPLKEPTMISLPLLPQPYQPGGGKVNYLDSADAMLETEFAPPDRYFTVSALLGRLRDPMNLPLPPNSRLLAAKKGAGPKGKKGETPETEAKRKTTALEKQRALLALDRTEMYHREQPNADALLQLYKKISSHRTAQVFRKPVDPATAPGYAERIQFPMDLSLIRKMIVARMIKTFASLHGRVALICHNCVKFNGRESDYAVMARNFEDHVDDKVLEAVLNATVAETAAAAAAPAAAGNVGAIQCLRG